MKSLTEQISGHVNEARMDEYKVAFLLPNVKMEDLESFTVLVPHHLASAFEEFLEDEQDNTVYHASDKYGDFEI